MNPDSFTATFVVTDPYEVGNNGCRAFIKFIDGPYKGHEGDFTFPSIRLVRDKKYIGIITQFIGRVTMQNSSGKIVNVREVS